MQELGFQHKLFTNKVIDKRQLKGLISDIFNKYGSSKCTYVADKLKFLGFRYATQAGLSLNIEDLRVPDTKKINLMSSEAYIRGVEESFARADITSVDRFQFVIDKWSSVSDKVKEEVVKYFVQSDPFNPIYMMAFSGARGNLSQVRQLIGMRGLMSDPQGQLIGLPIKSNFREGLTVTEYIISSYGARKGIVDTALRTADSGYLTRRLVDVSQDIIVKSFDCGTSQGVLVFLNSDTTLEGRTSLKDIYGKNTDLIIKKNVQITKKTIELLKLNKIDSFEIRSSITCELNHSICQLCYGWNLATRKLIDLGEAVGILAAQSIGEPGTQLTMRTFHTGGTFMGTLSDAVYSFDEGKINIIGPRSNFKPERFSEGEWNIKVKKPTKVQLEKLDGRVASLVIPQNSSIPLKQNNFFVKANQIISKPPLEESTASEQITKRVSSDKQGLIYLDNLVLNEKEDKNGNITQIAKTQGFVWVCLSDVITVPTNTLLQVKSGDLIKSKKCLVKSNISNSFGGFFKDLTDTTFDKDSFNILLASYFLGKCNIKKVDNFFFLNSPDLENDYKLSLTKQSFTSSIQVIGESVPNLGFKSKSGRIKIENYSVESYGKGSDSINTRVHLIPEFYYNSIHNSKELFIKAGDFVTKGCELFSGTFAEEAGIVDILVTTEDTFDLVLRPGILIDNVSKTSNLSKSNKKVIKGSSISFLEKGKIEGFVYIEQLTFDGDNQSFLISSVESYLVPPEKEILFETETRLGDFKKPLRIFEKVNFLVSDGDTIKSFENNPILLNQLVFEFTLSKGFFNAKLRLDQIEADSYNLRIDIFEKLNPSLGENISSDNIRCQKLLHKGQYIYASSRSFENQLLAQENSIVSSLERVSSNRRLLCIAKKSDLQIFKPNNLLNEILSERKFTRRGNKFKNNLFAQAAGRFVKVGNSPDISKHEFLILQRSKPYLIAKNSILKTKEKYLVRKNDLIAFLTYEVAKTADIIQGLPRVEELLEARPPKNKAIIAGIPGFVSVIETEESLGNDFGSSTYTIAIQNNENLREKYTVPRLQKIVKTGDFVKLGQKLTDGQVDLRELLQITFDFYRNVIQLNNYSASIKSFRNLQTLLISEIQNVYKSQGVDISDKHIEIIVRQMTTKVRVEESGKTTLVPGELIDLEKIRRINAIAQYHGYATATYTPVLLGITKASLSTDSFISAASFQETARVLTKAAVEGKKDWLKGLKENVIVGRLIPAGTGFQKIKQDSISSNQEYLYSPRDLTDSILDKRVINQE